jgi:membrane protein YdbS with pleckstrin-like domain
MAEAEVQIWSSHPSWAHFSWLYFVSAMTAVRGLLILRFQIEGWEAWMIGAAFLLAMTAGLRHWAENVVTSTRVLVRNGYTGHEIQSLPLTDIADIVIKQGPLASFFDIGTLVLQSKAGSTRVSFKGVPNPELLERRITALIPDRTRLDVSHEGFL